MEEGCLKSSAPSNVAFVSKAPNAIGLIMARSIRRLLTHLRTLGLRVVLARRKTLRETEKRI